MHYDEISGDIVGDDEGPGPSSYRPVYQRPAQVSSDEDEEEDLWTEFNEFISSIGNWFEANSIRVPTFLSFATIALVVILIVVDMVRTWEWDPCSAILVGVICVIVAFRFILIALGILYGLFWLFFLAGRLIFKNAKWFTVAVAIYYFSTHPDALEALIGFVQSLFPASQMQ